MSHSTLGPTSPARRGVTVLTCLLVALSATPTAAADSKTEPSTSSDSEAATEPSDEKSSERPSPKVSPESVEKPPPPPLSPVLSLSVPHLVLGAISGDDGRYWPMGELTLELNLGPKLSVAPIAGGMYVTTGRGTRGVITAGVQGRAYITDTYNSGIYGAAELLGTGSVGYGDRDPTVGVHFVHSGLSPSAVIGMKLNAAGGFIVDANVGMGVRYILADQFSSFDVDVDPGFDVTMNLNLGWGFGGSNNNSSSD